MDDEPGTEFLPGDFDPEIDSDEPSDLLAAILEPLEVLYRDTATIEARMSRPGEVVVERRGQGKSRIQDDELGISVIEGICEAVANVNGLKFHPEETPKVSCVLPGGHRFECVVGPSAQSGLSLAIRCKHPFTPEWSQIGAEGEIEAWLKAAAAAERNIVISGATNTGKTTLLNMLLAHLPEDRRVIAVEDTPELHLERFWDGTGLLSSREATPGVGMLDWRQLYDHVVRVTPDHVVFGEISTQNAFAALAALNMGTRGFMCTIHAESARQAIERKFEQNVAWSGQDMPRVPEYLKELVDVVVQIKREHDGWRRISEILEPRTGRYLMKDGRMEAGGFAPVPDMTGNGVDTAGEDREDGEAKGPFQAKSEIERAIVRIVAREIEKLEGGRP